MKRRANISNSVTMKISDVEKWVKRQVGAYRFEHIRGVVATAQRLARQHHLPEEKALLAAWFHDCAKEWTRDKMSDCLRGTPFQMDVQEKALPVLWHPHAGAAAAFREWGIRDSDVFEAIRCHTLGHPKMGPLAQVVFVADFIEPGRKFKGVAKVRRAASSSLKEGVLMKTSMTIQQLLEEKKKIHPRLLDTWNAFL